MGRRLPGAGLLVCAAGMAFGQPAPSPSFEVASVKPAALVTTGGIRRISSSDRGRLTYNNATLRTRLVRAYQALLFAAVQSLGLRLEPRKAPIDILVVDYAEKTPTEN
ncbi:MAG: TIGR03435 family protein [Bryobacteraceae bacterium]